MYSIIVCQINLAQYESSRFLGQALECTVTFRHLKQNIGYVNDFFVFFNSQFLILSNAVLICETFHSALK